MSTCTLGYIGTESPEFVEAVKAWAAKWNATELEPVQYRDVTLEDRNYSEGLIVGQDEDYEYRNKARTYPYTMRKFEVQNASKECWSEQRAICRGDYAK